MASAVNSLEHKTIQAESRPVTPPLLPNELWLQIFEQVDDVEFLWCTLRLVSREYKALVDRVFVSNHLPTISISLSLPRLDPVTGRARYAHTIPGAEITMQCQNTDATSPRLSLQSTEKVSSGATIDQFTESGALTKQRLDEAQAWMWFGKQRPKGANVTTIDRDVLWNDDDKVWIWTVEWEPLVNSYFAAKRASRQVHTQTGARRRPLPHT